MPRIFISYRREDGIADVGRIYERLCAQYGADNVFMDLENIPFGDDFMRTIEARIAASDLVIAIIGRFWAVSRDGRQRLFEDNDVVRRELLCALEHKLRILPVVIDDVRMARSSEIPPELAGLSRRNAVSISKRRFSQDVDALLESIDDPNLQPHVTPRAKLTALRQRMRARWQASLAAMWISLLAFLAATFGVFELLKLDTHSDNVTMWLGDLIDPLTASDEVLLVAIDTATEAALKKPFAPDWRHEHALLIDRLAAAGARSIAFDILFQQSSLQDEAFAAAAGRAQAAGTEVYVGYRSGTPSATGMAPMIRDAVSAWGLACLGPRSGYAPLAPLAVTNALESTGAANGAAPAFEAARVSLPLLAAFGTPASLRLETGRELILSGERSREIHLVKLSVREELKDRAPACPALGDGDRVASLAVRLSSLAGWREGAQRLRYEDVLAGSVPASAVRGKIVLVGLTRAPDDQFRVAYRFAREQRFGVELHADTVSNLRSGIEVHPIHWGGQALLSAVMAGLGAMASLAMASRARWQRLAVVVVVAALYLAFSLSLYVGFNAVTHSVYHLLAFLIAFWATRKLVQPFKAGTIRG